VSEEIPAAIVQTLREIVGLAEPDPADPLHRELWRAIADAGPHASYGQRVVALRWVFNWALREAGSEFATAKADFEHAVSRTVVEQMSKATVEGRKLSLGLAQAIAEKDNYTLKLQYLLAEQHERAMRKFLDTLAAALDNHRTDRADMRGGDRAAAQGYGGGS
jgi:hypothetical protein